MTYSYPEIEPHEQGMLAVGDGNLVRFEVCGDPQGKPALVLHGGPGSGCSTRYRSLFDPAAYRIVLFDQRGCGGSLPHAGDPRTDLSCNTTDHLLADIEALRTHLDIEHWLVFGASWGSTLGLAYAQRHPHRVSALVLAGVTTTRRREIDWLYRGMAPLFPQEWSRFRAGAPAAGPDDDLVEAYARLLEDPDPAIHDKAASDWHAWEGAPIRLDPKATLPEKWSSPVYRLARARLITHYFRHAAWLDEGILLKQADRLAGIPGVLVQGRLDLEAPLTTAWELSQVWPDAELVIVQNAAHSPGAPDMQQAIIKATDGFR